MNEESQETAITESTPTPEPSTVRDAVGQALDQLTEPSEPEVVAKAPETPDTPKAPDDAKAKTESPLEWEKLDPRAKKEFETVSERYRNMQKLFSQKQNEWKAHEEKLAKFQSLQEKAEKLDLFDKIYSQDAAVKAAVNKALGLEPAVDPSIEQDPLFQYFQSFEGKLKPIFEFVQKQQAAMQEQEKAAREKAIDDQVAKITDQAVAKYKELLGKDPTEAEIAKMYAHMVERKVYDGEAAALSLFQKEFMEAKVQAALDAQMKKKAVGTRVSTVNSSQAKSTASDARSVRDYVSEAVEQLFA